MTEHLFDLIPFPDSNIPEIKITGTIAREQHILSLQYLITGSTEVVLFPKPDPHPGRKDGLWQTTCFEFFLAAPDRSPYWEFNLSPSGDWNVFRMDAYRQVEFREEALVEKPWMEFKSGKDCFHLHATVDLGPVLGSGANIQAGIAGVIQTRDGHLSYWALIHPGQQPDFHLRESFIVQL